MNKALAMIGGAGVGAGAMYLLTRGLKTGWWRPPGPGAFTIIGTREGEQGRRVMSPPGVKDVMTPHVEVIHPDASLEEAAVKMKTLNVGVMPVGDAGRLAGILTDRDIVVRVVAEGRSAKDMAVRDAMTAEVVHCFEDDSVQDAAMLMVERQIRRLVVLNSHKQLVGIVSLGDLAVHTPDTRLTGEVLEYVSEPANPPEGM